MLDSNCVLLLRWVCGGGVESLTYTIGGVKQMGCLMGDPTHKLSCAMTHLPGIEASLRFIFN